MMTSTHRRALSSLVLSCLLAPTAVLAQTAPADPAAPAPTAATTAAPTAEPAPATPPPTATATATVTAPTVTLPTPEARLPWLHQGLEFGLRAGFGLPFGDSVKDVKVKDTFTGKIPIQLDVGYRFNRRFYVGAYGEYAFGLLAGKLKDDCDAYKASCSARTIRFGLNVTYHLLTRKRVLPWVGLGGGYQIAAVKVANHSAFGETTDVNAHGFEFVHAMLGADIVTNGPIRVGPVVEFSLAQHRKVGEKGESTSVENKALHQWLTFGIRGAFNL